MADRRSAHIFGEVFKLLAESPTEHKCIAGKIFEMTTDYDFNAYQMDADDACLVLGVAQKHAEQDPEKLSILHDAGLPIDWIVWPDGTKS